MSQSKRGGARTAKERLPFDESNALKTALRQWICRTKRMHKDVATTLGTTGPQLSQWLNGNQLIWREIAPKIEQLIGENNA